MLPSLLIFPVFNFFRRNIWHSIFDQFHFQHIFWDEMTVSSDNTGKEKWQLKAAETFLGTIWMVFWEKNIWRHSWWGNKYLYFSYLNFTMKGVTVKKAILRFFSGRDLICDHQKYQPWRTPPSSFLPISPRCLTNIRCRYFSLKIWVVYDHLELDWYLIKIKQKLGLYIFKYFKSLMLLIDPQCNEGGQINSNGQTACRTWSLL